MSANELLGDRLQRLGDAEPAFVRFDLGEEHAFEQEVADFAPERGVIAPIDGVENLVGFFEHESAQRLDRLLAIPWASARPAQPRHDVDELLKLSPADVFSVDVCGGRTAPLAGVEEGSAAALRARFGMGDYASIREWKLRRPASRSAVSSSRSRPRPPCILAISPIPNTGERAEPNLAAAAQMIELIAHAAGERPRATSSSLKNA